MIMPVTNADLCFLPAVQQRALLLAGELSARDLLAASLERIEVANPAVNAIVTMDVEGATRRARELDDALARGEEPGPLHGLVVAPQQVLFGPGARRELGEGRVRYPPVPQDGVRDRPAGLEQLDVRDRVTQPVRRVHHAADRRRREGVSDDRGGLLPYWDPVNEYRAVRIGRDVV